MANETVVRVTADATGYTSALEKAQRSNQAFLSSIEAAAARTKAAQDAISEAAENGSNASSRSINAFIQSLARQADAVGKSRSELLQLQAAQMGVTSSAQPFIDKIKAVEEAMNSGGHAAGEFSLKTAGARRELLVLAHEMAQGNWKKFGGSLMVLGEKTDAMAAIMSPAGLAAGAFVGALAAVAVAAVKGAEEENKFNQAIIMTGSYAGMTRGNLESMAETIAQSGNKVGTAKEVLLSLAESGRFTGGQIASIGPAATAMAEVTGMAVKDVVKQFEQLGEDPVKASVKLNEQYHYLTLAVYEQIDALDKQGDRIAAASVAEKAWADAANERARTIQQNLGLLETAWHGVGTAASEAWSKMMGLGKTETTEQKIASLQSSLKQQQDYLGFSPDGLVNDTAHQVELLQEKLRLEQRDAEQQAQIGQAEQGKIAAQTWMESFHKEFSSQAEKRKREIEQYTARADKLNFTPQQRERDIANINDKYKDKAPKHEKAYADDAATRFLQQLRDQDAALQAQVTTTGKMSEAEKELVKFDQQISDWKGKTLTADQKSLVSRQDELRAQLQVNVAHAKAVEQQEAINKLKERSAQIDASIASYQEKQQDQYGRQLDAFGMGSEALKNVQAVKSIYAEYQRLQEQLDKATPKNLIGGADYAKAAADIKAGLDQSLADYDAYYAALKAKQADWTYGATAAIANYMDAAHNMAAQTQSAVTNMGKGMEDAITTFVTTGKLSFSSLADSIISDIVRMQARAAVSGLFSSISGFIGSAIGGAVGSDIAGSFGSLASTASASSAASDVMGASYSSAVTGPSSLMPSYASLPQRVSGGPVADGASYLVGEKGPEMFVPSQAGSIVANKALGGSGPSSIRVELVNEGSQQSQVKSATPQFDATGMVLKIILTDLQKGGPVRSAIQNLPKP